METASLIKIVASEKHNNCYTKERICFLKIVSNSRSLLYGINIGTDLFLVSKLYSFNYLQNVCTKTRVKVPIVKCLIRVNMTNATFYDLNWP